ncbi:MULTISPECIES: hypothetical protein [unclassified Ensifer]|uniref:hypothetical protein n=1 Tax=unclassified Ensifer TaxID=2633371 RepID=UPI000813374A|nr:MULTISPECIES: hypothetical protein [unclassified Ensifer]OCO98730.1 hypothetical protein BC362_28655 [Ensifer sp. LC14]OCP13209.1 hypothetical protein BC374_13270 [Ensifer sp. LC13]OCP13813.1 hypothetical protein BBX50_13550 [Ensifer sp. LC11]OCP28189.1 hypothetical protein BC364_11670 [Ensifer sp. LC499]
MQHVPYVGSGPYCYANSFAMMFGDAAPSTAVIEFSTSSPFGMQLIGGSLPFFDPYGWDPEAGFDGALEALGWTSEISKGGDAEDALSRLRSALKDGPVWVGPVEMGHLRHQPGMTGPIEADHYVVALTLDEERVLMHDPQGYPYAALPIGDFMAAWEAKTLTYGEPFTMRWGFRRVADVSEPDAIRASTPAAIHWLSMRTDRPMPAGSFGNADAAEALAALIEGGCDKDLRAHLIHFAVRVGTRRAADAATCLSRVGLLKSAAIAGEQARLIGALQYPLVVRKDGEAAEALRRLAPTYDRLLAALRGGE